MSHDGYLLSVDELCIVPNPIITLIIIVNHIHTVSTTAHTDPGHLYSLSRKFLGK
jgi:hypothetical protein